MEVYEPYQQNIDIDELSTKHYNLIGINEISAATRKQISMDDSPEKVMVSVRDQMGNPGTGDQRMSKKTSERERKRGCSLM